MKCSARLDRIQVASHQCHPSAFAVFRVRREIVRLRGKLVPDKFGLRDELVADEGDLLKDDFLRQIFLHQFGHDMLQREAPETAEHDEA